MSKPDTRSYPLRNPDDWVITDKGAKKITDDEAWDIMMTKGKTTHREKAEQYGLSISAVLQIRKGERRKPLHRELSEIEALI